ncbi:thiol reductant ABC exporter subunit CydC [Jongsikchunia kroppenstedtii]|uniref:thiol reductant ABC exporter subunit CydC n=1 Tax=Jongsikchunia kroppenstedtii TaxID=1121721 RepID=UPI0005B92709|nr:thiol reductant ABC exporter subunit CydC [Jongsikchunia kroppenstedtii]
MSKRVGRDPLWRALRLLGIGPRAVWRPLLAGVGTAGSALALAVLSAWLITRAWQMPPVLYLSVAVTSVRALGISRGLFRYLERLSVHDLALRSMTTLRETVYSRLAGASSGYTVRLRQGELLSRTGSDVDDLGDALIRALLPAAVAVVTGGAAIVVMALISVPAAVILAAALLFAGLVGPYCVARGSRTAEADTAAAREHVNELTMELLSHGTELAVAGRHGDRLDALRTADHARVRAERQGNRWAAAGTAALPAAIGISVIAALLVAITLSRTASPMEVGILVLLPLRAFEAVAPMTEAALQFQRSRSAARRLLRLLDGADAASVAEPPAPRADERLVAAGLRWSPESAAGGAILGPAAGLDLTLGPGERVVVVGPNGCGKTTLLLTLAGLLPPAAGTVDGAATYFPDDGHVFTTSVRENLLVAKGDATEAECASALHRVGLTDWVSGLPNGLDTPISESTLSGGQRRRILLARVLIHPAPIVLIDEPVEHVDDEAARDLQLDLLDRTSGLVDASRTVVVVSHRLPAGHHADRVLDLDAAAYRSPAEKPVAAAFGRA